MTMAEAYAFLSHGAWLVYRISSDGRNHSYNMRIPVADQNPLSIPLTESFFYRLTDRWSFDVCDDKDKSKTTFVFYYLRND